MFSSRAGAAPREATSAPAVGGPRRADAVLVAALVVSAFLAAFGALHYGFYTRNLLVDTPIYERYGDAIVHGRQVPYRDFAVEYPPGALPAFAGPALAADRGDFGAYARLFELLMLVCGAGAAALVGLILTAQGASTVRLVGGTLLAGLAPLALGPVVLSRYDLWPAALTIAALAALIAERRRLAFGLLGGAIVAKVYPAVVLPLAVAYVWRRQGRREAVVSLAVLGAAIAVCVIPFAVLAPRGLWDSFSGQASRPLQIESLGASILLAAHQAWGLSLREVSSHGSDNLEGALPDALASAQSLLAIAVVVALWIAFARGPVTRDRLLRYAAATVCAFVALGKVLSPQYLIWLMALVPLVRGRRGVGAAALFLSAMVLTQLWFPYRYIRLAYGLDPRASWLVLARDVALVALLLTLVWPRRRVPRLGVAVIATLAAGAAAAFGAAMTSSATSAGLTHSSLLDQTGVASSCGGPKEVPATSPGTIHYEAWAFRNRSRERCVTVTLRARSGAQAFSATYRGSFMAANPQANYVGDSGTCTNFAGASGATLVYSFRVHSGRRFVVEVEECDANQGIPPYVLHVSAGRVPVAYRSASAVRTVGGVAVRWRTRREDKDVVFEVYREAEGRRLRVSPRVAGHRGAAGASYSYSDQGATLSRTARYWLHATARGHAFSWYGPIAVED